MRYNRETKGADFAPGWGARSLTRSFGFHLWRSEPSARAASRPDCDEFQRGWDLVFPLRRADL